MPASFRLNTLRFPALAAAGLLGLFGLRAAVALTPSELRCEYAHDPVGVESANPRLSWALDSPGHDHRQGAYRILVATAPERLNEDRADLWDSGKVESPQSVHVGYGGRPLTSRQRCYWRVRVWDQTGRASAWSRPSSWEMGLLRPEDWRGHWIGAGPAIEPRPPAGFFKARSELTNLNATVQFDGRSTLLRKEFNAPQAIRRARVYVSGLGYYELTCNGRRVGDRVLAPAKTNYRQWVLYDTYDVTPLLQRGANALGLQLGNGWFNPDPKWWEPYRMQWFGSKRALLQLHLDYADGSSALVASDESWTTAPGPVLAACVYDGETYDATQEQPGWDRPGFDDRHWSRARQVEPPGGRLVAHTMPGIAVTQRLRPVAVTAPRPGCQVFDLGQNFAGWVRLTARGPRGTRVTLRYAEDLNRDGTLDPRSNERALATDVYRLRGEGLETYEPRFTFHGFRYVEISGLPEPLGLGQVEGCVVHTACAPTGSFAAGHDLVTRLNRATLWSQRSNLMGYPMDCPQRDERLGWLGDAMVTAEEAMFNFDSALFWRHWLEGLRYNQNPADGDISIVSPRPYMAEEPDPTWSSAYLVVGWQFYRQYGDRQFLEEHFDAMRRYVDYLSTQATNQVLPKYWIGDWGTTVAGWQEGEPISVSTGFYYLDATILAKAARVLGRLADAARYERLAQDIRTAYNRAFYDARRQQYDEGTQFSQAFPLELGLVEPSASPAVLARLEADLDRHGGHFTVGVLGAKYVLDALTRHDRSARAWQIVNQRGYPSWSHLIEGRTTLSEFWDLRGSHNHVMMGSVDAWFYRVLAGIQTDDDRPGFERVMIKPFVPADLPWVRARVPTLRGPIAVQWRQARNSLHLEVTLPPNLEAAIHVPALAEARVTTTPRREPVQRTSSAAIYQVGSGRYTFTVRSPASRSPTGR